MVETCNANPCTFDRFARNILRIYGRRYKNTQDEKYSGFEIEHASPRENSLGYYVNRNSSRGPPGLSDEPCTRPLTHFETSPTISVFNKQSLNVSTLI